ncbi:MAG: O-antigen ligase family protein [Flavobacteriales bacterium]|jgi:O-antigen ligase
MKFNYPRVYQWALMLLLAGWMLLPGLTGLFCLLFLVIVITGIVKKELTFKFNIILLGVSLFLPFYSLYAMNAIDPQEAMFGIEKKLSFVLFPLVFSFVPTFYLNKRFLENGFLISLFLMLFLCYLGAFFNYEEHNYDAAYLFSSHFSGLFHHPTYVSVFCALGIFVLFKRWEAPMTMREHLFSAVGILFLLYTHVQLESLSGLLFAVLLMACLVGYWLFKKQGWTVLIGVFTLGMLVSYLGIYFIPSLRSNVFDSVSFVSNYVKDPYAYTHLPRGEIRGNDARLILWTASAAILREHPNGVGVGNLPTTMEAKLLEYGQVNLAKEHLNPHNQFFHTAVETGWIGLLWLLGLLISMLWYGWKNKQGILILVVCAFAFNSLFESMLERQSGIVFWLLWSCLFIGIHPAFKIQPNES